MKSKAAKVKTPTGLAAKGINDAPPLYNASMGGSYMQNIEGFDPRLIGTDPNYNAMNFNTQVIGGNSVNPVNPMGSTVATDFNSGIGETAVTPDLNQSWFAQNKDMLNAGAQGLQALGGLANAYMGYKNYGLAKDQFGFEKAATNANYINAAKGYNTDLQNSQNVGLALGGGAMTPEQIAASNAYINSRKVSERPIG